MFQDGSRGPSILNIIAYNLIVNNLTINLCSVRHYGITNE